MSSTNTKLIITLDDEGVITEALDEYGNAFKYDETDEERLEGSQLQLAARSCCWRIINGVPKCRSKYCRK